MTDNTRLSPHAGTPLQASSNDFAATTSASQTVNAAVQMYGATAAATRRAETFLVNLGVQKPGCAGAGRAPVNAVISAGQGTGTITDRPWERVVRVPLTMGQALPGGTLLRSARSGREVDG